MNTTEIKNHNIYTPLNVLGFCLILIGGLVFGVTYFKITWLLLLIAPIIGLGLLASGISSRRLGLMIAGCVFLGLGTGLAIALAGPTGITLAQQFGLITLGFGISWMIVYAMGYFFYGKNLWWALIPAISSVIISAGLFYSQLKLVDFTLIFGLAVGVSLLFPGIKFKLFGLIIPGCLVISASIAVYVAWSGVMANNPLSQTGAMLVVFALGWGMITLCSRVITEKFVWWPLIPGGVLAMTGWGLYIGGDPNSALNFIGNTGSVGLIIFGIYLLLMRRGIHR